MIYSPRIPRIKKVLNVKGDQLLLSDETILTFKDNVLLKVITKFSQSGSKQMDFPVFRKLNLANGHKK